MPGADDVDQADELGAVSANWRWLCDGENLFVVKAGDIDIWSGDAGSFYSKDYSATLQPRAVLPAWWEVKFQHLALPGSFNTDTLLGCELSFQSGTMCYHTLFGSSVRVAPAQGDCAFQNFTAADSHVLYEYKSSAFGVQTYRSSKTCYPKAAFEEIRVQMEDVVLPADRFETEVGSSDCRTTIRLRLDAASYLSGCEGRSRQREPWPPGPGLEGLQHGSQGPELRVGQD